MPFPKLFALWEQIKKRLLFTVYSAKVLLFGAYVTSTAILKGPFWTLHTELYH